MLLRTIKCPPDKSLSHRALLLALYAKGTSKIRNLSKGLDVGATRSIVQQFAEITLTHSESMQLDEVDNKLSTNVEVRLKKEWEEFFFENKIANHPLRCFNFDCRNSGTTARLAIGMFSSKPGFSFMVDGDDSLRRRPMKRLMDALKNMGLTEEKVQFLAENTGMDLPLKMIGTKLNGRHVVLKTSSAQLKSACLLAALSIKDLEEFPLILELPTGSRDHTEIMLQYLGVELEKKNLNSKEILTLKNSLSPWKAFSVTIPRDPSAGAFWSLFAFLNQEKIKLPEIALNPTRIQWVSVLKELGFQFEIYEVNPHQESSYFGEIVGDIIISPPATMDSNIHISSEQVAQLIDELPLLATICCFNQKQAMFEGVEELILKESNRLQAIQDLVALCGRRCEVFRNRDQRTCLKIFEKDMDSKKDSRSHPKSIDARSDHRIAMIATMLKFLRSPDLEILNGDEEVMAVSDPAFLFQLKQSLHDKLS